MCLRPCAAARTGSHLPSWSPHGRATDLRHRRRPPGQTLQDHDRRRRHFVYTAPRLRHRTARGQWRGQDYHHRHDHGPGHADIGERAGAGRIHAARALPRAAPDEFREPLCRPADAVDGAAESLGVRRSLCRAGRTGARAGARCRPGSYRPARSSDRQTLRRTKDARFSRQGAAQSSRSAAARRTDRVARSRYSGLGAGTSRALQAHAQQRDPARLAQHERGRAALRARNHHEEGPYRRRRFARATARPLRAGEFGRSVPRCCAGALEASRRNREMSVLEAASEFSFPRVGALVRRYWYLLRSSWPRILDLIYWPTVQMLMWGFLQMYVAQNAGFFARAGGVFIGSVLLWDILFRGQLGFSISFLEEMYARNLANLMMSPLRPVEFIAALLVMSLIP